MNKKLVRHAVSFLVLTIMLVMPIMAMPALTNAQDVSDYDTRDVVGDININQGDDLMAIVVNVINWVLGLLGLIAVIIIIIAGFEWMTAGGDSGKVDGAKTRMRHALIGLAVIFLAWVIVGFVLRTLVHEIA